MMMSGFFASDEIDFRGNMASAANCGACGLHLGCKSPMMEPTGEGRRRVLIVAEAPGKDEDEKGVQLIGVSGQRLRSTLCKIGVDLDRDCIKTNSVICRPPDNPDDRHVEWCRPNVFRCIEREKPRTIVLLGERAIKSVIGPLWGKTDLGGIGRWAGWTIPCRDLNAWICPTWHPSYLLREGDKVLDLWFERHLEKAFSFKGRPWPDVIEPFNIEVIRDPREAASAVRDAMKYSFDGAFDFETNMLKPDRPDAAIWSCAICFDGARTIASRLAGEYRDAVAEFLQFDRIVKIGWNAKFEQRWAKRILGFPVRNWMWDGMVAAHVLDNRPKITGLKFQAFVQFGIRPYDAAVEPFLKADGSNVRNRIAEADQDELLRYNGMDALLTYMIAKRQMGMMRNAD